MNIRTALLLLLLPTAASALTVKPEGSLRVEGDSTLHKWSSTATVIFVDIDPGAQGADAAAAVAGGSLKSLELRVPVAELKSGESGLDKNMRKAMNADKHPAVSFKLVSWDLGKPAEGVLLAATTGELTINGTTKTIALPLEMRPGAGSVAVRGSYELKMSDYGIPPPKLMMGAIKVRDAVTVRFDLTFKKTEKEN